MWIAVKKELVGDLDEDGNEMEIEDAFPDPPILICRTDRKNEASPSFKGHISQVVMIKRLDRPGFIHLCLVGLNFDTEDNVRGRQVERLERYIQYHFAGQCFACVIWGDFNNRLVCPEWLAPNVNFESDGMDHRGEVSGPELMTEGAKEFCALLADPKERLKLMKGIDSWVFTGKDANGKNIQIPLACSELRRLFTLHFDTCEYAPLPTYKRTPLGEVLGRKLGFELQVLELVTKDQLERGLSHLRKLNGGEQFSWNMVENMRQEYFYHDKCEITIPQDDVVLTEFADQRVSVASNSPTKSPKASSDSFQSDSPGPNKPRHCAATINCGWPDRVGVLKKSVIVDAELQVWGTCESLRGSLRHAPLRASVRVVPQSGE